MDQNEALNGQGAANTQGDQPQHNSYSSRTRNTHLQSESQLPKHTHSNATTPHPPDFLTQPNEAEKVGEDPEPEDDADHRAHLGAAPFQEAQVEEVFPGPENPQRRRVAVRRLRLGRHAQPTQKQGGEALIQFRERPNAKLPKAKQVEIPDRWKVAWDRRGLLPFVWNLAFGVWDFCGG